MKTIALAAASRDTASIDGVLRPLVDEACRDFTSQDDKYWRKTIFLLMKLNRLLDTERVREFVVYVDGTEWKRFSRASDLSDR